MGAWIETDAQEMLTGTPLSHPVWVRGLKRTIRVNEASEAGSHPVWVRGLKHGDSINRLYKKTVAPRVGAWIET